MQPAARPRLDPVRRTPDPASRHHSGRMTTTAPPEGAALPTVHTAIAPAVHPALPPRPSEAPTQQFPRVPPVPMPAPVFELSVSYVLHGHDRAALGRLGAAITAAVIQAAEGIAAVDYQFANVTHSR